jgi:hypothetical protein
MNEKADEGKRRLLFLMMVLVVGVFCFVSLASAAEKQEKLKFPKIKEDAILTYAPVVPPPLTRKTPALIKVYLESSVVNTEIKRGLMYSYWTFNGRVPGPFIRSRVGDVLEVHHTSTDESGMPHNVDFHAVTGPGGGAPVTTVVKGEERIAWFKLLHPGLYIYHCAAPPVMDHVANGMYGLILVEPKEGLPKVDHEFYVMQSEIYAKYPQDVQEEIKPDGHDHSAHGGENKIEGKDDFWGEEIGGNQPEGPVQLVFSHQKGLDESPMFVFLNGSYGALQTDEGKLKAKVGEKVRIYWGNAGPNLISSFHVIGEIFDNVYREGDLTSPPGHNIQSTLVPAGGATAVEFDLQVPGTYTLVDHAIFRVEKGAVGYLEVEGKPNHEIYVSDQDAVLCEGCLVHP